jgi:hypothetical protein
MLPTFHETHSGSIPNLVQGLNALNASLLRDRLVRLSRCQCVSDMVSDSTAEHDDIEQRVRTKTVGTVHRHTSGFSGSVQTRDNLVIVILVNGKGPVYLVRIPPTKTKEPSKTIPIIGRRMHTVVVHGGKNRDRLLGDDDTREDGGSFRDTGQQLVEDFSRKVFQL